MARPIKNKKLLKIHNAEINIEVNDFSFQEDEFNNYIRVIINVSDIIEPAARPRTSSRLNTGLYDPLSSYKNYIKKELLKKLPEGFKPMEGKASVHSIITIRPPSTMSDKQKLSAIREEFYPLTKPDNDNYEKTIFDIFKNILWKDDSQVYYNSTRKIYGIENHTLIDIHLYKLKPITGRISKDEYLTDKEKEFLKSYKKVKEQNEEGD